MSEKQKLKPTGKIADKPILKPIGKKMAKNKNLSISNKKKIS